MTKGLPFQVHFGSFRFLPVPFTSFFCDFDRGTSTGTWKSWRLQCCTWSRGQGHGPYNPPIKASVPRIVFIKTTEFAACAHRGYTLLDLLVHGRNNGFVCFFAPGGGLTHPPLRAELSQTTIPRVGLPPPFSLGRPLCDFWGGPGCEATPCESPVPHPQPPNKTKAANFGWNDEGNVFHFAQAIPP